MMLRRILALLLVAGAPDAFAQDSPGLFAGDWIAPRIRPDAASLTTVVLTYQATLQQAANTRSLGERSVQLGRTTYAGLSAWEIVETRGAGLNASVDTLIADFATLLPLHWGATQPMPGLSGSQPIAARIAAEFRADTMIGVMSSPAGRRSLIAVLQPGAYVTAAHFEVGLRGLPVAAPNWKDSTWVVVSGVGKSAAVGAAIMVTGEEKLITTAGSFDCWIVSLTTAAGQTRYWVSKTDRIVVQTSQVVPETGGILLYQLSRISH
jgi:hypothetical protein